MDPQEVIILMVNFLPVACRRRWQYHRLFIAAFPTAIRTAHFIWVTPLLQAAPTLTVRVLLARIFINAITSLLFPIRVNRSPVILRRSLIPTLAMFAWSLSKQFEVLFLDYSVRQIVFDPLFYFFQLDYMLISSGHFRLLLPLLLNLIHQTLLFLLLLNQVLFQSI